jgi:hypothetical protein
MEQFLLKQVRICICNSTWHRGEKDEKKNTNIEGRQTGKLHKKNRDTHNIGGKKNRGKEPEKKEGERENQRTEGPSGLPFRTLTKECLLSLKQQITEPNQQRRDKKKKKKTQQKRRENQRKKQKRRRENWLEKQKQRTKEEKTESRKEVKNKSFAQQQAPVDSRRKRLQTM